MAQNSSQVVEDVYKHDLVGDIQDDLKKASRANDRLAFGMYRAEVAKEFKTSLEHARNKIDNLLKRL